MSAALVFPAANIVPRLSQTLTAEDTVVLPGILTGDEGLNDHRCAVIADIASTFRSQVRISSHGPRAHAGNTIELQTLEARAGDTLRIEATGPDASLAVATIVQYIRDGFPDPTNCIAGVSLRRS